MDDFEKLKQQLHKYISLDGYEINEFCSRLSVKMLKRKEFLYREGQICKSVVFVANGCLRYYYLKDGEEQTMQFFLENAWYTDYESFLTEKPSLQYIQALEPTTLLILTKLKLYELYEAHPKIERFGRIMAENAYLGSRKNNLQHLILSPEERYLKLIQERPKVIERVALKYIASYLGIKPESLSRIRKRIFDEK